MLPTMKTTRLAPWFGADSAIAKRVGAEMGDADWACVLFTGGCGVLPHIRCRAGVANDLHRHVINLARVVCDPAMRDDLIKRLEGRLFHPDELAKAQWHCRNLAEESTETGLFNGQKAPFIPASLSWAENYFIASWMARGGNAGTDGEFGGSLPTRYNANGGGSNTRYRSMVASLDAWHLECKRWEWECMDAFSLLGKIKDQKGKSIYADPPWVKEGGSYRHKFTERHHRQLAEKLGDYKAARIVVRYGDDPLIRELYQGPQWMVIEQMSRDQANGDVGELLIVNGALLGGGQ